MDLELREKVVVVTGGSRGLGGALVTRLVAEGATVVACARHAGPLDALRGASSGPGTMIPVQADVSALTDLERLFEEVGRRFGRLDGLVNNAGGGAAASFESITDQAWEDDLNWKLFAAIRTQRLALPLLRAAGGGSVVNVLAIAAKAPTAGSMPSSVSRAAGLALTKALAHEFGPEGIRVNAVLIGVIKSDNHARLAAERGRSVDEHYEAMARDRRVPLGRIGEPDEFADLAAFLLSPRSSYLSGAGINLDGGASPAV